MILALPEHATPNKTMPCIAYFQAKPDHAVPQPATFPAKPCPA
jgi:hypothetical protein